LLASIGATDSSSQDGWHRNTPSLIENAYSDLWRSDRLIVIDGHLTPSEFLAGFSALDVVCLPYYEFPALRSLIQHVRDRPGQRPPLRRRWKQDRFTAATPLRAGLAATVQWYLENARWWRAIITGD
jgi:hypothetical protein